MRTLSTCRHASLVQGIRNSPSHRCGSGVKVIEILPIKKLPCRQFLNVAYFKVTFAPASSSFAFNASPRITKSFVPSIHKSQSVRDPASENSLPDYFLPALKPLKLIRDMKKHRQVSMFFPQDSKIT